MNNIYCNNKCNKIFHYIKMDDNEKIEENKNNEDKKEDTSGENNNKILKLVNIKGPSNNCIDLSLIIITLSSIIFGILSTALINNVSGIGYIGMGIFSSITLCIVKKTRLRVTIQNSVNVLKKENDELKENVDDLEENILTFKNIEKTLREDISALKKVIGLVGDNSNDALIELKNILSKLSEENKKHEFLVKNQIISYLYDNNNKINNFKEILQELYKDISWEEIVNKIKTENIQ